MRHTYAILITATAVIQAFTSAYAYAQEVRMPDRWQFPPSFVPPIFSEDTVTIRILGDIMMHDSQIKNAYNGGEYDFSSYFEFIADDIMQADLAIANMEFTLAGEPYSGYPCFSAPDSFADYLADCGFDVFLTANNHIFDKGKAGVERTLGIYRHLNENYGVRFTGTASNEDEQQENNPLIITRKGIRLAFINATYGTNMGISADWPETCRLSSEEKLATTFSRAEEKDADLTIAFPHWGTEYVLEHSMKQEETALFMASMGADMIIGAHPHVIQDFQMLETIRDSKSVNIPVIYSLGNAVSNMSAANTQMGLMATIRVVRESNGDIRTLPIRLTYLWCSRPGGFNDSYTVLPVAKFIGRKDDWKGSWDYDKMIATYRNVSAITGIKDKDIILNE